MFPLAAAIGAVLFASCGGPGSSPGSEARPAPHFELKDLSGQTRRLSDFRGQLVLLDFWATWCVPCHESIPFFEKLHGKYGPKGFTVVGVSQDASERYVPEFVKRFKMTYPVLMDPATQAGQLYGVTGLPTTFLVDRQGVIRGRWVGFDFIAMNGIDTKIRKVLQEK